MILRLLDLVFSSEDDLVVVARDINRLYPSLMDSHVLALIDAKNYIVRKINNSGQYKYNGTDVKTFNQWDFLDIADVRDASTYYALYSIYNDLQDASGDVYREKADIYLNKFNNAFQVFRETILKLDINDNGKVDTDINEDKVQHVRFYR
jgi:hypothetical protein